MPRIAIVMLAVACTPSRPVEPRAPSPSPAPAAAAATPPAVEKPAAEKPAAGKRPAKSDAPSYNECKPSSSRLCNVSLGDSTARCTMSAIQYCNSDGRWGVCQGRCETTYTHYGHSLHCENRFCRVTRRCERSGPFFASDRCEDTHDTQASTRVCCPHSQTRPCYTSCYGSGGSCSVSGTSTCEYDGKWGACRGSCSFVPYGGGLVTCQLR